MKRSYKGRKTNQQGGKGNNEKLSKEKKQIKLKEIKKNKKGRKTGSKRTNLLGAKQGFCLLKTTTNKTTKKKTTTNTLN